MQFEIEVPYTTALLKRAIWSTLWDRVKISFLIIVLGPIVLIALWGFKALNFWYIIFTLLLLLSLLFRNYWHPLKLAQEQLKKLEPNPLVRFNFTDETIRITSEIDRIETQWKGFNTLKKLPSVWLLYINAATCFIIPTELLTPEQQTFILDKLKENQVKIR